MHGSCHWSRHRHRPRMHHAHRPPLDARDTGHRHPMRARAASRPTGVAARGIVLHARVLLARWAACGALGAGVAAWAGGGSPLPDAVGAARQERRAGTLGLAGGGAHALVCRQRCRQAQLPVHRHPPARPGAVHGPGRGARSRPRLHALPAPPGRRPRRQRPTTPVVRMPGARTPHTPSPSRGTWGQPGRTRKLFWAAAIHPLQATQAWPVPPPADPAAATARWQQGGGVTRRNDSGLGARAQKTHCATEPGSPTWAGNSPREASAAETLGDVLCSVAVKPEGSHTVSATGTPLHETVFVGVGQEERSAREQGSLPQSSSHRIECDPGNRGSQSSRAPWCLDCWRLQIRQTCRRTLEQDAQLAAAAILGPSHGLDITCVVHGRGRGLGVQRFWHGTGFPLTLALGEGCQAASCPTSTHCSECPRCPLSPLGSPCFPVQSRKCCGVRLQNSGHVASSLTPCPVLGPQSSQSMRTHARQREAGPSLHRSTPT